jgi:hypothetical protein
MENHPTKHRPFGPERHHSLGNSDTAKADHPAKKKSFTDFLIDSGFAPLVFVGRCLGQFGARAVAGFLLGAIALYGYGLVSGLPYVKSSTGNLVIPVPPAPEAKTVKLHGFVRDFEGRPVKEAFNVGVLAKQLGPVQNSDGSFEMEVPQSNSYDVALWNSDTVKVYTGFAAEQDGRGYRLSQALPFLQAITNVSALSAKPGAQLAKLHSGEQQNVDTNPTAEARLNTSSKSNNFASAGLERRTR